MKKLEDMSNAELWHLFPIKLVPHNPEWQMWYKEEQKNLLSHIGDNAIISQMGSTAVRSIWAKPIVDIMVEVTPTDFDKVELALKACGYRKMCEDKNSRDYNKGYTESGFAEKVFHLHLRCTGDNKELYFLDYLNDNPDVAKKYQDLKLDLWKKFEFDRDGYTSAKSEFIKKYTDLAIHMYRGRYER